MQSIGEHAGHPVLHEIDRLQVISGKSRRREKQSRSILRLSSGVKVTVRIRRTIDIYSKFILSSQFWRRMIGPFAHQTEVSES